MVMCLCVLDARPSVEQPVAFSAFYGMDKTLARQEYRNPKDQQEAFLQHTIKRVRDDAAFQRTVERGAPPAPNADPDEVAVSAQPLEGGFRMEPGRAVDRPKFVLWYQHGSLIVFTVAELSENIVLLQQTLSRFVQHLTTLSRAAKTQTIKLRDKTAQMDAYLKVFLPQGQAILFNSKTQQLLHKQVDALLKASAR
ncbi:hypothetical protein PTSG_12649 [Salpingoeca rosetta]|uniref:Uncharacterized protein n=1 Tax=Salpingoeca rosetta (strain ATCC 50818 / BSB-021) TaxID=946362 RepID=F2UGK1_SALR5|nr:uncharacterized protein PTSG_12649 [Salpingoeca rosetta]EGD75751.1 hypothetical protein PTSG_12649 [Salpingoeca rosetta]|eukprot:XP_004991672.1 hypothetical protein PTSG_12649 [Salpingoeca rosetta]